MFEGMTKEEVFAIGKKKGTGGDIIKTAQISNRGTNPVIIVPIVKVERS